MKRFTELHLQIRVFIVSNVRLYREGLVALLRGCPSIEVLGAHSMQETQNVLRTTAPDVALIDALSLGDSDMVGALRKMCARVRILAVGVRETASEVLACAAAGIDGYVPMDAALGDMVTAIENVVRGELTCSPKVAASLYQCISFSRAAAASPGSGWPTSRRTNRYSSTRGLEPTADASGRNDTSPRPCRNTYW